MSELSLGHPENVSAEKRWLASYPPGVPSEIPASANTSLVELLEKSCAKFADRKAFSSMGKSLTYRDLDIETRAVAAWLQSRGLEKGDRVAVMMPNILQNPVAVYGILRAGMIVVNVNPLYTPRELEHQLKDSGSKALFVLENFAHVAQQAVPKTAVRHVVVAAMGDLLGLKGHIVNLVVRKVKKLVPAYAIPGSISFKAVLKEGQGFSLKAVRLLPQDIAFLQYTGGTTGISKGAILTHANLLANKAQISLWLDAAFTQRKDRPEVLNFICALPLCHIFALTVNSLMGIALGGHNLLIANPRDIPGFVKELSHYRPHIFPGINTLFNALMNNEDFRKLDLSSLILVLGGGMAVQRPVAERWLSMVGCPIAEGYGLSETSPVATVNRLDATEFSGTIGLPISSTEIDIRDEEGKSLPTGEVGEICIRGPQVMAGYWQRPDETAKAMTEDGFFRSGDMGFMDERGYTKIVDRKKDMILVSGFNVYPNEIEEVAASHPGVLECAAIGVPDEHSGETVKLFVVKKDQSLTEAELKAFCAKSLTNYKRPKIIEFRTELPKSNVGKILRRELRNLN
ncbi:MULTISPECIES: long-chain fatty acid--CoA ligase [Rhizobium/Agrobacterium group]|jgi:long-chain acyl-CoA synthetase|uniref:Long-chain-fatty-acid--CoA ligase n=3 Tax=Rhizobium/Agrobacterium group TaxID=227290 RepID=A0A1V2ANT7_AGRTU|nr:MULTISPECIES: long-chain fatty acid--CoA ligase [Rhizobium/Agrobacterium group]AHK00305.1 long-chain-fatty-acid-CoA ligase [Agrobacterium tumefaciens LBA4213 (Ach5)]AKC06160.1 long-chain acyl-CoA synthetase [Agrobacterium tumefaciens]EHJ98241.1 Long-chain-fatty-acid--CoA ligase [Agrobacterium tumefaciens 5A]QDG92152.1 long-chain fatty acid--CoA ligase [Rhizobium sp. NIBRBAC000502774]AYM09709.1 long-chain acyl-CoA synthetase [Agrobacterium tumefaciens]